MESLYRAIVISFLFIVYLVGIVSCRDTAHKTHHPIDTEIDSLVISVSSLDSLERLAEQLGEEEDERGEMIVRKTLGSRYDSASNFIEAVEDNTRALALAKKLKDTASVVTILNQLGVNYRHLGVLTQAAENHYKALTYCNSWSDKTSLQSKRCRVDSYNGIGNTQLILENYERAEFAFRSALAGEKELGNFYGQAVIYAELGAIKEKENQNDSAFWYYDLSLEMNRNAKSKLGISLCYVHFGRLAEKGADWDAALRYYYRSYDLMKSSGNRWYAIEACLSMARVYIRQKDMVNARKYMDEGWKTAEEMKSWKMMAMASTIWSDYEEKRGNEVEALRWHKLSDAYADSVSNEEDRAYIQNLTDKFIRAQNQKEVELLEKNYRDERAANNAFVWWGTLFGFFGLLSIAFLLYILRVRMRSQQMMCRMEKVRSDFFTNITHEFRTPLTVMMGLGRQIAENTKPNDDKECRRLGAMIVRQGDGLLSLVNQLLDIAKTDSSIGHADWRTDDIVPFIKIIMEGCKEYASQNKVGFSFDNGCTELCMDFVPDYIRKILHNLLSNAVKFSGEGGQVMVKIYKSGDKLTLVVRDSGRGMSEKDLPYIFDPFYTASNYAVTVSTGVGLTMVRQMVFAMDGTINVESKLNVGTEFVICLPLKHGKGNWGKLNETADNVTFQSKPIGEKPVDGEIGLMKPTVLVIDDDNDVANFIGMQLNEKYRVVYAFGGKEGLAKAADVMPDLIVTDLMMPQLDGYGVCRGIRQSDLLNHIPIVIVSAKSMEADKIKGIEAGADAYLNKPFSATELLAVVANLLESRKALRKKYSAETIGSNTKLEGAKPYEREFLNKLIDIVYQRMSRGNMDAESLASAMCMSSSQLRRKLFSITGEKLNGYVLQIRMGNAKKLLLTRPDMSVGDVATHCGFDDAAYFSRLFKSMYQLTPSQYRKQSVIGDKTGD